MKNNHPDLFYDGVCNNDAQSNKPNPQPSKEDSANKASTLRLMKLLGNYLSPYANTSPTKDNTLSLKDISKTPQIKIVPFGTGSGKTYSSHLNYIKLQTMGYDLGDKGLAPLYRNSGDSNYTNAVFITPSKNQIEVDDDLLDKMNQKGITPVSFLGMADSSDSKTTLWLSNTNVTIFDRIKDYKNLLIKLIAKTNTTKKRSELGLEHWVHINLSIMKSHTDQMLTKLKELQELQKDYNDGKLTKKDYELRLNVVRSGYFFSVNRLVLAVLNNTTQKNVSQKKGGDLDDEDAQDATQQDEVSEDGVDLASITEEATEEITPIQKHAYTEAEVYEEIFKKALPKQHFDELLSKTAENSDDVEAIIATLKKDILRVYAPLFFSAYNPSFICMTTSKLAYAVVMHRFKCISGEFRWVCTDRYTDFAELVGNKVEHNRAIEALPVNATNEVKINTLREGLLKQRKFDENPNINEQSIFKRKDIDFYIIIDESNTLFEKEMHGEKTGSFIRGASGVVKSLMPTDFSINDVFSCIVRKFRELVASNRYKYKIHCQKEASLFFLFMKQYIEKYCDIPIEKVLSENGDSVFLNRFSSLSSILYINNSEADLLINIAENAFTVGAKSFINKTNLESIYLRREGHHTYLSLDQGDEESLTLHEVYQVLIAVLYACVKISNTNLITKQQKEAFILDLGYQSDRNYSPSSTEKKSLSQNSPLHSILTYAKNHHKDFIHWLESRNLDGDGDFVLDEWYAYIQTKLVFTMNIDKTFDTSVDEGHKTKTFINIGLCSIRHHPEVNLLRMVDGTSNHVAIMSATAGREFAYSCQHNIGFLRRWGEMLGIKVSLPEYDNFYDIDYREVFKELRELQRKNRTVKLRDITDTEQFVDELNEGSTQKAKSSARLIGGGNKPNNSYHTMTKIKNHLFDVAKNMSSSADTRLYPNSPNERAFHLGILFLMHAFRQQRTSLHISLKMNVVKLFLDSIRYELRDKSNRQLLETAIENKQKPIFVHRLFGEFQLPLLNKVLDDRYASSSSNPKASSLMKECGRSYCYITDFLDMPDDFNVPFDSVVRFVLYSSDTDKVLNNYKNYFEIDYLPYKGINKTIYTHILSYNAASSVGLNNIINNRIQCREEDIQNLFMPSLAFYTAIKSGNNKGSDSLNELSNIHNALYYMRYVADPEGSHKRILIKEFDSNLSSKEAKNFLEVEHGYHLNNSCKQTLGRIERRTGVANFESCIYIPKQNLVEQIRIEYDSASLDSRQQPTLNKIDYEFMSMTNNSFYLKGMDIIRGESLSDYEREQLEQTTADAQMDIRDFTNGVMGKIITLARSGDKSENHKKLADMAISFDLAYREHTILSNPPAWKAKLKQVLIDNEELVVALEHNYDFLDEVIDQMYIDASQYKEGIHFYQDEQGGLTDFFGRNRIGVKPYSPHANIVKNMQQTLNNSKIFDSKRKPIKSVLGSRLESLIRYNNSMTDCNSSFYELNDNKNMILHPSMLHMALGNLGEEVFNRFIELYKGEYRKLELNEVLDVFGYKAYEFSDFWLKVEDGSYVCVDVKNMSHSKNKKQAKDHYAQQYRKSAKIEQSLSEEGLSKFSEGLFATSNKACILYVNIRENKDATSRKRIERYNINGRQVELHIYNVCLFQTLRYTASKDTSKAKVVRNWMGFLSVDIIELLGIKLQKGDTVNKIASMNFSDIDYNSTYDSVFDLAESFLDSPQQYLFNEDD